MGLISQDWWSRHRNTQGVAYSLASTKSVEFVVHSRLLFHHKRAVSKDVFEC